jgi:hypothetical protein
MVKIDCFNRSPVTRFFLRNFPKSQGLDTPSSPKTMTSHVDNPIIQIIRQIFNTGVKGKNNE